MFEFESVFSDPIMGLNKVFRSRKVKSLIKITNNESRTQSAVENLRTYVRNTIVQMTNEHKKDHRKGLVKVKLDFEL